MITIDIDPNGPIGITTIDDEGISLPSRMLLVPGTFHGDTWISTDVSEYPIEVQNIVSTVWTDDVINSYKALLQASMPGIPTSYEVDLERERRISLPLIISTSVGQFPIDMDVEAQRNLNGLATAGLMLKAASLENTTPFRDYDNNMHDLTPDDLILMGQQVMSQISTIYSYSWNIKAMSPIPSDYTNDKYWSSNVKS